MARRFLEGIALSCSLAAVVACTTGGETFEPSIDASVDADPGALGFVVDGFPTELDELTTAPFTVKLGQPPAAPYAVRLTGTGPIGVDPDTFELGPGNWDSGQTVILTGRDDDNASPDDGTVTIEAVGVPTATRVVRVNDLDRLEFQVDVTSTLDVPEPSTGTFQVRLSAMPQEDVTASIVSGGAAIQVLTPQLRFTSADWREYKAVEVRAVDDVNIEHELVPLQIRDIDDRVISRTVQLRAVDDDQLRIDTSPATSMTVVEGGGAVPLSVSLNRQPQASTTVTISASSNAIRLNGSNQVQHEFTTTTWNQPFTVAVTAADDDDTEPGSAQVMLSGPGPNSSLTRAVTVAITDDDRQVIEHNVAAPPLVVAERGTAQFNVWLRWRPAGTVQVTVISLGAGVAGVNQTLIFEPATYNQPQQVTVAGVSDQNLVTDTTSVRLAGAGALDRELAVRVDDRDAQEIEVASDPVTLSEGTSAAIRVRLRFQPATSSVAVTATTASSDVSVTATPLGFDQSDWNTYKELAISASTDTDDQGAQATVTLTGAAAPAARNVTVNVTDPTILRSFGWPSYFNNPGTVAAGYILAYPVTISESANLLELGVIPGAEGSEVKMALYRDAAGAPGGLVTSFTAAQPLGTQPARFRPNGTVALTSGTYWIAFRVNPSASIGTSTSLDVTRCTRSLSNFDAAWPTTFGTASCAANRVANVFVRTYRQP